MENNQIANKIRRKVLTMLYENQKCHLGSNMSVIEILTSLYFGVMKENDIFISSKGHCAATLYAILEEKGIIKDADKYFKQHNLISHEVPGVLFSGGSLGQGLSVACGMALAKKKETKWKCLECGTIRSGQYCFCCPNRTATKGFQKIIPRVFCLLGDGELQEGNVWEAVMFAAHHKLDNLTAIVDYNGLQAFGETNKVMRIYPIINRFLSFDWSGFQTVGHSIPHIQNVLKAQYKEQPHVVVCRTIKGKGVPAFEDKLESHYLNINKKQYEKAIRINSD